MKVIFSVVLLLFTPILAVWGPTKDRLIGHWRYADENLSCDIAFRNNGTFTGSVTQHQKVVWEYAGKWSLTGDMLNYEYTKSSLRRILPGTMSQDKLIEVTKDYYVIEARDGNRRKYTRIQ